MSDDFYASMYGAPKKAPAEPTTKPEAPKIPPPAYQRLSGLKLSGQHMHEVEINGRYVTIPSAAYIKLLEDQIRDFRKTVTQQTTDLQRAVRAINKLNLEVDKLKTAMAGTVKKQTYRGS